MSMTALTIVQAIAIFILYTLVTVGVPYLLLKKWLANFSDTSRLFLSFLCGNFFIINIVYLLQLLHISNRFTLIVATLATIAFVAFKINHFNAKDKIQELWKSSLRFTKREIGVKTAARKYALSAKDNFKIIAGVVWRFLKKNLLEMLCFLAITATVIYVYGTNLITTFGYCASDITVHNYWINAMSDGDLFVAGIYPFGFHCIIYYFHAVFGVKTYILLRVFFIVQTILLHWILLLFLKSLFMTRYTPYIAVLVYALANIFPTHTYSRFISSLPLEFGMLFILPAVHFGFEFFAERRAEHIRLKRRKEKSTYNSNWCLVGFILGFSMTFAIHFYDTMIAGVFCVALALGYFVRFVQWDYLKRIVISCLIAMFIAVLPMGVAYVQGTSLQGSLGWGLNVMYGITSDDNDDEDSEDTSEDEESDESESEAESADTDETSEEDLKVSDSKATESETAEAADSSEAEAEAAESEDTSSMDLSAKLKYKWSSEVSEFRTRSQGIRETIAGYVAIMKGAINTYVFTTEASDLVYTIPICIGLLLILALIFFALGTTNYAAKILTITINSGLMVLVLSAGRLGIPKMMDASRASIYFVYMLPILWFFAADAIIVLFLTRKKKKWIWNFSSFFLAIDLALLILCYGYIKEPYTGAGLETNEAVICLTNILYEEEDYTWTIVSANDELQMADEYGYHTEIIDLLTAMEYFGDSIDFTIPTQYVYFFIEKVPVDYNVSYEGSGQVISEDGASRPLPLSSNLTQYQGERRWIIMSKMYYWAQAFIELYPNEMTVYFENDNFVCYRLTQNINNLFNLCIDYGYNTAAVYEEVEE